jgi:hypothetical protein
MRQPRSTRITPHSLQTRFRLLSQQLKSRIFNLILLRHRCLKLVKLKDLLRWLKLELKMCLSGQLREARVTRCQAVPNNSKSLLNRISNTLICTIKILKTQLKGINKCELFNQLRAQNNLPILCMEGTRDLNRD